MMIRAARYGSGSMGRNKGVKAPLFCVMSAK